MTRLIEVIRQLIRGWVRLFAKSFNTLTKGRVHPDTITLAGLVLHVPIVVLIAADYWLWAALCLVVFGLLDTLDGELARLQKRVTNNGGFLDAATDRIKEVLLYGGVSYWFVMSDRPEFAVVALAACGASLCVSYIKAKGEAVIAATGRKLPYPVLNKLFADGLVPFEIRMTLLLAGLLSGYLVWAVGAIAILASYTVLQRMLSISRALKA